jgi:hypothetical protein
MVTQFVDANELSPEYVEKPYFVVPEPDSVEASRSCGKLTYSGCMVRSPLACRFIAYTFSGLGDDAHLGHVGVQFLVGTLEE